MTAPTLVTTPTLVRAPALVGCSHGTDNPLGQAAIASILADVRALRPDLEVHETYVDVQHPQVDEVVARALAGRDDDGSTGAVVVPLLLSGGFHVNVDIAAAVAGIPAVAAAHLGPDPRLVDLLCRRLEEAGVTDHDWVVLAAAGSSDAAATRDVEDVAASLRARRSAPVTIGYGSMAWPKVQDAVAHARAAVAGTRASVVVASYLLAPGFFHDRLLGAGADLVSAPLAPEPVLAEIVLDRYDRACSAGSAAVRHEDSPAERQDHPVDVSGRVHA